MAMSPEELEFTPSEAAGLRLMQIGLFAADLVETRNPSRPAKQIALDDFCASSLEWARLVGLDDRFAVLDQTPASDLHLTVLTPLRELELERDLMATFASLELLVSTALPDGCDWAVDRVATIGSLVRAAYAGTSLSVTRLSKQYRSASKALAGEATSPKLRLALAGGTVAVTVASGGIAAAVGTAIGGAMGLSGAAATSAGLAWLGGGSLAAGGFGMAGGTLLVAGMVKGSYAGARTLATKLAAEQTAVFVSEVAKLCAVAEVHPNATGVIVSGLKELKRELKKSSGGTGEGVAKSRRGVEAAIRRIEDGSHRGYRTARLVTRAVPVPGANKKVDELRRWQKGR